MKYIKQKNPYSRANIAIAEKRNRDTAVRRAWVKEFASTHTLDEGAEHLNVTIKTLYQDEVATGVKFIRHQGAPQVPRKAYAINELARVWLSRLWK